MEARSVARCERWRQRITGPASAQRGWPPRWMRQSLSIPSLLRAAVAGICATSAAACGNTPVAFGTSRAAAQAHADELFTGLTERFTNVDRSPAAAATVEKVEGAVFTPSGIFNDTIAWNVVHSDSVRALMLAGRSVRDRYSIAEVNNAPAPRELAASREEIRLARLGHDQFEWSMFVDQVLGSITPEDVDRVIGSVLTAPAVTADADVRSAAGAAFPRSSALLAQFFSLDTLRSVERGDSTALVDLVIGLHPEKLQAQYPALSAYLRKYLNPVRLRSILRDPAGGEWLDLQLAGNQLKLRARADREGRLAPIDGVRRAIPDSLTAVSDFRTKMWLFSLGLSDLATDVLITRAPHVLSWQLRFQREPRWHLPLAISHLVQGSLRQPFMGDGARYRVAITNAVGERTLLEREGDVTVQESAIMRWFGGLGAHAFREFSGPAEAQESAYLASLFSALRADVDADLTGPATVAGDVGPPSGRP
jgi:hypothetical protein